MDPGAPTSKTQLPDRSDSHRWFAEEVVPHQAPLRRWLKSQFPWLSDVEDVAQDALLRLWKRQHRPDASALRSPKSALFTIARNAVIDRARHIAVAKTDSVAEFSHLHVIAEGHDVVEQVDARQQLELLKEGISLLPDRCRQVITLTKIYGLSEREVCERLDLAESSVRTHVIRGLERLDDYLAEHGVWRRTS